MMRTLAIALISWLIAAPVAAPAPDRLLGVWDGTMFIKAVGTCRMLGDRKDMRLVVLRGGDGKVRAGLTIQPAAADRDDGLTLVLSDKKVRLEQPMTASCGQTFTRKYSIKYEGAWPTEADGKRTLHLEGFDAACSVDGCRFLRTLDLEWKREPPEYK